ncbi:MAG: S-layer homology domain-containing protein [Oscillospiraceae bacterium]
MKKRILAGFLCLVLALALVAPAFAAETVPQSEKALVLKALDVMVGDETGALHLERVVNRAEFTKLVMAASPVRGTVGTSVATDPYPDVSHSHWAAPWVQAAVTAGYVKGNLLGYFEPARTISLAEGVTMVLRILGYSDSDFSAGWPAGQMALYHSLNLDGGVTATADSEALTRGDALNLIYNLLGGKTKTGQVYGGTLGYPLTAGGTLDNVALVNAKMEGPIVTKAGWETSLPFDGGKAAVHRNGTVATFSAIQPNDVVYWSKPMNTLWAYSGSITGTLQKLSPSAAAPTSVTVANQVYTLETSAAAFALSDLGSFRMGDTVTLLLGRSGGVAAVQAGSAAGSILYGMVTGTTIATYTDGNGKPYTASAVSLMGTDGKTYTYQWTGTAGSAPQAGDLVQVIDGTTISRLSRQRLSGTVNTAGTQIGGKTLAQNVQILDTYGDAVSAVIYPARLAGMTLSDDMVQFYATDAKGEITHLILNDATGDLHRYGVLTEVNEVSMGMMLSSSYVYEIGGITQPPCVNNSAVWNLKKGPCQIKSTTSGVERIYNLTELPLTQVAGNTALVGTRQYTLADGVSVYEVRGGDYYLTDISRVKTGYNLTGYYDKAESEGGRIRVILATAT